MKINIYIAYNVILISLGIATLQGNYFSFYDVIYYFKLRASRHGRKLSNVRWPNASGVLSPWHATRLVTHLRANVRLALVPAGGLKVLLQAKKTSIPPYVKHQREPHVVLELRVGHP